MQGSKLFQKIPGRRVLQSQHGRSMRDIVSAHLSLILPCFYSCSSFSSSSSSAIFFKSFSAFLKVRESPQRTLKQVRSTKTPHVQEPLNNNSPTSHGRIVVACCSNSQRFGIEADTIWMLETKQNLEQNE